jgi:hypothetical protein
MAIAFLSLVVGGASAADNTASITIHLRQCNGAPTTDYFTDCHGNGVMGMTVSINAFSANTDASGNVTDGSLAAGDYDVTAANVPGATSYFSYCSSDMGRAESFDAGDFTVDKLATGEVVTCDVYGVVPPAVPTTGTLTIHARVCAVGQPTTDIFTDCHGNTDGSAGVAQFSVDAANTGTVDASGNISWTDVPNGAHAVTEDVSPAGTKATRVFCSSNGGTATEVANTDGDFSVTINGDDVVCDSYSLLSTGTNNGNGSSGNSTGNGTSNSTSNGTSSGNGTTLPNTGTGSSAGTNNFFYGFSALLFVALVAFGGAEVVRRRQQ